MSEVSERANEWVQRRARAKQRRARAKQAVRSNRMSERCERKSEQTSEWPSTTVTFGLLVDLAHSVMCSVCVVSARRRYTRTPVSPRVMCICRLFPFPIQKTQQEICARLFHRVKCVYVACFLFLSIRRFVIYAWRSKRASRQASFSFFFLLYKCIYFPRWWTLSSISFYFSPIFLSRKEKRVSEKNLLVKKKQKKRKRKKGE